MTTTTTERLYALPEEVQAALLDIWTRATNMTPEERAAGRLFLGALCINVALSPQSQLVEAGHLVASANQVLVYVDDLAKEVL